MVAGLALIASRLVTVTWNPKPGVEMTSPPIARITCALVNLKLIYPMKAMPRFSKLSFITTVYVQIEDQSQPIELSM